MQFFLVEQVKNIFTHQQVKAKIILLLSFKSAEVGKNFRSDVSVSNRFLLPYSHDRSRDTTHRLGAWLTADKFLTTQDDVQLIKVLEFTKKSVFECLGVLIFLCKIKIRLGVSRDGRYDLSKAEFFGNFFCGWSNGQTAFSCFFKDGWHCNANFMHRFNDFIGWDHRFYSSQRHVSRN